MFRAKHLPYRSYVWGKHLSLCSMFSAKHQITKEYILGIIQTRGNFGFHTLKSGNIKRKIPFFSIELGAKDADLLREIKDFFKIKNRVYVCGKQSMGDRGRSGRAIIIVRDLGQLKNLIVPMACSSLRGNKKEEFTNWISTIGSSPEVPKIYKIIYELYKIDFYLKSSFSPSKQDV